MFGRGTIPAKRRTQSFRKDLADEMSRHATAVVKSLPCDQAPLREARAASVRDRWSPSVGVASHASRPLRTSGRDGVAYRHAGHEPPSPVASGGNHAILARYNRAWHSDHRVCSAPPPSDGSSKFANNSPIFATSWSRYLRPLLTWRRSAFRLGSSTSFS